MDTLLHQVLSGLATGGIYASVALALVMIYQATHLVNFAQGEMAMFSTYIAWTLIRPACRTGSRSFVTVVVSFVIGVVIERVDHAAGRERAGAGGGRRVHRPAGDLQQRGRLDLHLHDQDLPEPVLRQPLFQAAHISPRTNSARWLVTLVVLLAAVSCSSATRRSAWRCGPRR